MASSDPLIRDWEPNNTKTASLVSHFDCLVVTLLSKRFEHSHKVRMHVRQFAGSYWQIVVNVL